jgi:hypothetical protein
LFLAFLYAQMEKRSEGVYCERTYHEHRGQSYIPKPIMEMLGNPNAINFTIQNKKIELEAGN